MKEAKRFPFFKIQQKRLLLQQSRLTLWLDNHSQAANLPSEEDCRLWVWQTMENQFHHANITVMFCDEEEARQYNAQYRDKNYATNVLSFALNEGEDFTFWQNDKQPSLDGDLILCPQVVEKEAAEQGKSTQEHYAHLIVHGTLHLMGHDHIEDDEAQIMESLEIALMNQLGYDNPYLIKEV